MNALTPSPDSHYDVYIRAGNAGFYFRNDNHGVTLTAQRISWTFNGQDDAAPFSNIRSVHLQCAGEGINSCLLTFADGFRLFITNANDRGVADPARRPIYRDFLRDLHGRLAAARPRTDITFTAGLQGFRYPLAIACGVLLGIVCVLIPIVGAIALGEIGPLTLLFGGVAFYWPLVKELEKNTPRTYEPQSPPGELLG